MRKPKMKLRFIIWNDGVARHMELTGKTARTLDALVAAGQGGITAIEMSNTWALRLAAYVHDLRHAGLDIKTTREEHEDGWHARYILHTSVELLNHNN